MREYRHVALALCIALFVFAAFTTAVASAAECIEIGTGTATERNVPFYGYCDYGWSKIIYTQSEINKSITITKIAFNVSNTPSSYTVNNQKIYMAHTTESSFPNGDKPDPSAMTLVYEGSITWDGSGWHNISFTTPFSYNNVNNLLIYYENRDGSDAYRSPYWYYTSKTNRAAYNLKDCSFPETAGYVSNYVPNIRLDYTPVPKTLSSLTDVQASTEIVQPGYENNSVLRLDFEVTGLTGTLNLTEINVTSKNTDDSDIAANGVKAYITSTPTFSTANQFGSGTSFASKAVISGTYDLPSGTSYVWITYDIAPNATLNNTVDAKILANDITVNESTYPASAIDPAGSRTIAYGPVHNLNTGENFTTIQAAIYVASTMDGHTISVDAGTYTENVNVNKSLTIKTSSGSPADTIVQAASVYDDIFNVTADYVNISGFRIENATGIAATGIYLYNVMHCNIKNNNISNNNRGIYVNDSSNNNLTNNSMSHNTYNLVPLCQIS